MENMALYIHNGNYYANHGHGNDHSNDHGNDHDGGYHAYGHRSICVHVHDNNHVSKANTQEIPYGSHGMAYCHALIFANHGIQDEYDYGCDDYLYA